MKKSDCVLREILNRIYEEGERFFKQKELAEVCDLSLGTVNPLIQKLRRLGCLRRKPQGFRVIDVERILTYWSATRDLYEDITFSTYVPKRIGEIEADLSEDVIFTGYSGYTKRFGNAPSNYSEIYAYAESGGMKKRFRERPDEDHNLFFLTPADHLKKISNEGVVPLPQLYVDLWQLGRPAGKFTNLLKSKLEKKFFQKFQKSVPERIKNSIASD